MLEWFLCVWGLTCWLRCAAMSVLSPVISRLAQPIRKLKPTESSTSQSKVFLHQLTRRLKCFHFSTNVLSSLKLYCLINMYLKNHSFLWSFSVDFPCFLLEEKGIGFKTKFGPSNSAGIFLKFMDRFSIQDQKLGAWSFSEGGNEHQLLGSLFRDICGIESYLLVFRGCQGGKLH